MEEIKIIMMLEMLIIFIVISLILFLLIIETLFYQESPTAKPKPGQHIGNWRPAVALISVNWLFIILAAYGFYSIEWFYNSHYWAVNGTYQVALYSTSSYYYLAYIFYVFFFIHIILFVKAGWDAWLDALSTEGEMNYRTRDRRW